jgi:hypothetical protein
MKEIKLVSKDSFYYYVRRDNSADSQYFDKRRIDSILMAADIIMDTINSTNISKKLYFKFFEIWIYYLSHSIFCRATLQESKKDILDFMVDVMWAKCKYKKFYEKKSKDITSYFIKSDMSGFMIYLNAQFYNKKDSILKKIKYKILGIYNMSDYLKLRKIKKDNFITLNSAKKIGITKVFSCHPGMGDHLMMMNVMKEYHDKKGEKPLCVVHDVKCATLFTNLDYCYVASDSLYRYSPIKGFGLINIGRNTDIFFDENYTVYQARKAGLDDDIKIAPVLELTDYERDFGRLIPLERKQISIMTGGKEEYKRLELELIQGVVDALKDKYDFIQVGGANDPKLQNVINANLDNLSYRQTAAVLANSDLFVGSIGGLMHLARSVNTPGVILHSAEPEVYAKYDINTHIYSKSPCDLCATNQINPKKNCPFAYKCIKDFAVDDIVNEIKKKIDET